MSWQAMGWALMLSPEKLGDVSDAAHLTLLAIANAAPADGRGAWPSAETLAKQRYCSVRTVRRHLKQLEDAGLIVRGDQRIVDFLPVNHRPIVWDLPMNGTREAVENLLFRGDTDDTPGAVRGDTQSTLGVTPVVLQTVIKPINSSNQVSTEWGDTDDTPGLMDRPGRDCIHGHELLTYIDKRSKTRLPMCPLCRRVGVMTAQPEESTHV